MIINLNNTQGTTGQLPAGSEQYKGMCQWGTSGQLEAGSKQYKGMYQQGTSGQLEAGSE